MATFRQTQRGQEQGVALIVALFALLLVSAVALGMMFSANTETDVNSNYRDTIRANYAARAGLEEARARLRTGATGAVAPPAVMPASGAGVLYLLNPRGSETVAPWTTSNSYFDTELCHEKYFSTLTDTGTGINCNAVPSGTSWRTTVASADPGTGSTSALDYKWVRVSLKGNGTAAPYYVNNSSASGTLANQVCWSSTSMQQVVVTAATCAAANPYYKPVYVLTSLAVTPSGSRKMAQAEITSLTLPPLPAAVTLTGSPTFGAPNSNPFHINGNDHPNAACGNVTGPAMHAIGVQSEAAKDAVIDEIPDNRTDHYLGLGPDPDVENIASSMGTLGTTAGLVTLTNTVQNMATAQYTGDQSDVGIGGPSTPQITFVDGDLTLSGTQNGAGILFVTGKLTTSGNFSYKGLIFVVGDGVWEANGGGGGRIDGGAFIANIYSSTTHSSGTLLSSPGVGAVTLDWDGGGGNGIYYNSCWISMVSSGAGFMMLSSKELPY